MDDPFSRMQDPAKRAERYKKMAEELLSWPRTPRPPFLRAYYQRIAEQYRTHAKGEQTVIQQEAAAVRERTET